MKSSAILRAGFVLISVVSGVQCITDSPPVKVSLRTSWPSPPFLLELMYVPTRMKAPFFL